MSVKTFLAPIADSIHDYQGSVSCQRIVTFVVSFVILGMWIWGCFSAGHLLPLGWPEAGLIGAAQGAKALQSRFELGAGGLSSFNG